MQRFDPRPGMEFAIGGRIFEWMRDPLFPEDAEVFARQGTEAVLYQLRERATASLWALKVFYPGFNVATMADTTQLLSRYAGLPGLRSAWRWCLTRSAAPDALARYPALEYAVLMPWIEGRSWAGMLLDRAASEQYTPDRALTLARAFAQCLWHLESRGLAHTDIAGGNILLNSAWDQVELVDIDRMYMPGGPKPRVVSLGSPGYAHPHVGAEGQWSAEGDRFAAAILLVEMLAWADPVVREHTPREADTLFDESDLQSLTCHRWQLARDALWSASPPALTLFDQVWNAQELYECPPMRAWADALQASAPPP